MTKCENESDEKNGIKKHIIVCIVIFLVLYKK